MFIRDRGNAHFGNPNDKPPYHVVNKFTCITDIYPTILDLLGVTVFSNLTYGVSAFSEQSSLLYSRAYRKFLTDKIYFNSMSNIGYRSADVDDEYLDYISASATTLLDKISHINRIFAADYFKGANAAEYYAKLREINEPTIGAAG